MNSKLYYRSTLGAHNAQCQNFMQSHWIPCSPAVTAVVDDTPIIVQVEGSEGLHMSLESDPAWHSMSLLISGTPLCSACVAALSGYSIVATDNMYAASKKLSAVSPGLRATRF